MIGFLPNLLQLLRMGAGTAVPVPPITRPAAGSFALNGGRLAIAGSQLRMSLARDGFRLTFATDQKRSTLAADGGTTTFAVPYPLVAIASGNRLD